MGLFNIIIIIIDFIDKEEFNFKLYFIIKFY
jgi:hypothetical protein